MNRGNDEQAYGDEQDKHSPAHASDYTARDATPN
jgi:hypothetical protein